MYITQKHLETLRRVLTPGKRENRARFIYSYLRRSVNFPKSQPSNTPATTNPGLYNKDTEHPIDTERNPLKQTWRFRKSRHPGAFFSPRLTGEGRGPELRQLIEILDFGLPRNDGDQAPLFSFAYALRDLTPADQFVVCGEERTASTNWSAPPHQRHRQLRPPPGRVRHC